MALPAHRNAIWLAPLALAGLLVASSSSVGAGPALTPQDAHKIGVDVYIYGYSAITTDITRIAFTNTAAPNVETLQAPMNQFVNQPLYPPATYKGVSAPNADTLYSVAFLEVGKEPMVFSYPDMGDRFFLFPMYSE